MGQHDAVRDHFLEQGYSEHVVQGGIPYLMGRWKHAIEWLEAEKRALRYEYLNDLDTRRILAEALPLVTEQGRGDLDVQLADFDTRFKRITVPSGKCVWGEANASENGWVVEREWWYFRLPIKDILD